MNNDILLKEVYGSLEKSMNSNQRRLQAMTAKFFETRSADMYDIAPFSRIYFNQNDVDSFFNAIGLSEQNVADSIYKTYYGPEKNFNPKAAQDPLSVTVLMLIRYYLMKKDEKNALLYSIYLSFSGKFYPSIHYGSFPTCQPSEYRHVMEYAVNVMMTDKFEIKKSGNLYNSISNICKRWIESYRTRFKEMEDEDVVYLIQQLRTRLASLIQNIAEVYYEAYKNKDAYLSYDSSSYDDDSYRIATNDSYIATECVESTIQYITSKGTNVKICKNAANESVQMMEVKSIIDSIQADKESILLIRQLITILIYEYFQTTKNKTVASIDFVNFVISPKPNTKNKNFMEIKDILTKLLTNNSERYIVRRRRQQTANNYERCILTYYAFCIVEANK